MAKKTLSFEESMQRLEEIVRLLVPLEESLALFEEGSGLIAQCGKLLDSAEQKVIKLKKGSDGMPIELPFDTEEQ